MKYNILSDKSKDFAVRILNLYKYLTTEKQEYILSKQIFRSGTSIGANIAEAIRAESQADFIHKLYISYKEAGETLYWIEIANRGGFLDENQSQSLYEDCEELVKMLTSIIKTSKVNLNSKPKNSEL